MAKDIIILTQQKAPKKNIKSRNVVASATVAEYTPTRVCLWCAHSYNNFPVHLTLINNGIRGDTHLSCFCTFQCAAAYNEYCSEFSHDKVASYTELNRRYNFVKFKGDVSCVTLKMAPSRLALKMFGGTMSIEDYRCVPDNIVYSVGVCKPPTTLISIDESVFTSNAEQGIFGCPYGSENGKMHTILRKSL